MTITTRQLLSHLGGIRHYSKDYIKKQKSKDNLPEKKSVTTEGNDKKNAKDSKAEKNVDNVQKASQLDRKSKDPASDMSVNKDYKKMTDAEKKGDERLKEFYMEGSDMDIKRALDIFKGDPLVHKPGEYYYELFIGVLLTRMCVTHHNLFIPFKPELCVSITPFKPELSMYIFNVKPELSVSIIPIKPELSMFIVPLKQELSLSTTPFTTRKHK